jgi:hypothetical protein
MTLDDIWSDFTGAIAEVELMLRETRDSAKSEMQRLVKNEEVMKQRGEDASRVVSMHNFSFKDIRTGRHVVYGHRDLSAEEAKRHVLLRKNRQYQWLLVEAYEAFEKLLVHIYAYAGATSQDCWPMKDYGDVSIAESTQKSFAWYLEQAKKKKGLPDSILAVLRKKFPALSSLETSKHIEVDLKFAVALTEKLRHQIVHARGWTRSQEDFIANTAKAADRYNNGVPEPLSSFAKTFFGVGHYENMVALLEIRTRPDIPIHTYVCRVGILTELLLGYGHVLIELIRPNTSGASA